MYPAVYTRVRDVIGNLLKRGVLQSDVGHCRIRQPDRMSIFAVKASQNFRRAIACTAMVRGIAREARSHDERRPSEITNGFRVAVRGARMDCRFGAPKVVVILVEE